MYSISLKIPDALKMNHINRKSSKFSWGLSEPPEYVGPRRGADLVSCPRAQMTLTTPLLGVADETNPRVAVSSTCHTHECGGAVLPCLPPRSFFQFFHLDLFLGS